MKLNTLIAVGLLGAALAAPAFAQSKDPFPKDPFADLETRLKEMDPKRWLGRAVDEADVARVFAWMRASMLAATQGKEPPPPPEELRQKAETLSREFAAQGALAGLALIDALEEYARRAVREKPPAPLPGSI